MFPQTPQSRWHPQPGTQQGAGCQVLGASSAPKQGNREASALASLPLLCFCTPIPLQQNISHLEGRAGEGRKTG